MDLSIEQEIAVGNINPTTFERMDTIEQKIETNRALKHNFNKFRDINRKKNFIAPNQKKITEFSKGSHNVNEEDKFVPAKPLTRNLDPSRIKELSLQKAKALENKPMSPKLHPWEAPNQGIRKPNKTALVKKTLLGNSRLHKVVPHQPSKYSTSTLNSQASTDNMHETFQFKGQNRRAPSNRPSAHDDLSPTFYLQTKTRQLSNNYEYKGRKLAPLSPPHQINQINQIHQINQIDQNYNTQRNQSIDLNLPTQQV